MSNFVSIQWLCICICNLALILWPNGVSAHGTEIAINEVNAVELIALFDDGTPMAEAQVSIYTPLDATSPWLTGIADDQGRFVFVPDRSIAGQWDIQLRTSGHGDWVYLDIAEGAITDLRGSGGGLTTAQIALMSIAIVWGFIGTALYFMRNGDDNAELSAEEAVLAS